MPSSSPSPPSPPTLNLTQPSPPNYGELFNTALNSYLGAYPQLQKMNAQQQLGQGQFAGMGANDLALNAARGQVATSDVLGGNALDLLQKYGPGFATTEDELLQKSDPARYNLRKQAFSGAQGDLALGDALNPDEERIMNDQIRGGQAARGGYMDGTATAEEVMHKFNLGQQLKQQRVGNALSLINGAPQSATAAAEGGLVPYMTAAGQPPVPVNPTAGAEGPGFGANIYGTGVNAQLGLNQNALGLYGLQSQNYQSGLYAPDPMMQALGIFAGAGTTLGAKAI